MAQKNFLERADQRFSQAGEKSEAQLKALLQPVEATLKRYEDAVVTVERERQEAYGNLTGMIETTRAAQDAVRSEAATLCNALRSAPTERRRWGEKPLRNVIETCGLPAHTPLPPAWSAEGEGCR